jgi:anti-sigma factor RsiW
MTNASTYEAMSCQELVELVTDYLEDALPDDERERFEQHLADCGNCQIYLEQIRVTIELSGSLTAESISPEAQDELLRAFRDWNA